jgi:hypothetical protein
MKRRVIRCGQKAENFGISNADVECLQNFWELQVQLGLRTRPIDDLMDRIPKIELSKFKIRDEVET